jgi:hypothetical protein
MAVSDATVSEATVSAEGSLLMKGRLQAVAAAARKTRVMRMDANLRVDISVSPENFQIRLKYS